MDYYFRESSSSAFSTHSHGSDEEVTYYLPVHTMPFWQQPTKYPSYYEAPVSYQPTMRAADYSQVAEDDMRRPRRRRPYFYGPRLIYPGPFIPGPFFPGPFFGPIIGPFPILPPVPFIAPFFW